jgi:hypothetical protein
LPQTIRVRSTNRITPENKESYLLTGVVPGSGHLLVAGEGYDGLSLLEVCRGRLTVISNEPGSGYEPSTTADGKKIFYRSDAMSENRKFSSVWCYDIVTGEKELMIDKGRGVVPPAVAGNAVLLKSDSQADIDLFRLDGSLTANLFTGTKDAGVHTIR